MFWNGTRVNATTATTSVLFSTNGEKWYSFRMTTRRRPKHCLHISSTLIWFSSGLQCPTLDPELLNNLAGIVCRMCVDHNLRKGGVWPKFGSIPGLVTWIPKSHHQAFDKLGFYFSWGQNKMSSHWVPPPSRSNVTHTYNKKYCPKKGRFHFDIQIQRNWKVNCHAICQKFLTPTVNPRPSDPVQVHLQTGCGNTCWANWHLAETANNFFWAFSPRAVYTFTGCGHESVWIHYFRKIV